MALEINDANIDETLANNKVVLVDFYASWCGPCRVLGPIIDKLSEENTDEDILITKVNSEESKDSVTKYSIRNLPTLLFFKNGELVDRLVGVHRLEVLKEKLDSLSNEVDTETEK